MEYFKKMRAQPRICRKPCFKTAFWSSLGVFCSIAALAFMMRQLGALDHGFMLVGSFGASAVMIFALPAMNASQPRSVVGGHVFSALCGVAAATYLPTEPIISASLAVGAALIIMDLTDTLHPPGGGTALLAVIDHSQISHLGFVYVLAPVGLGAIILVLFGLLINNIKGSYPVYWR